MPARAYRRKSGSYRGRKRGGPTKRAWSNYKRSTGRTRPYRTSRTRQKPMSRKKILNVTSEKKRDKMLCWTNTIAGTPQGGTTYTQSPAILTGAGADPYLFAWCATARDNTTSTGGAAHAGTKFDKATRTASECYMVGLSERIEIQCADGLPWQWRRICFTMKGGVGLDGTLTTGSTFSSYSETTSGYVRTVNSVLLTDRTSLYSLLFAGAQSSDWSDPMVAPLDRRRINVKYDKTTSIASGNEDGVIRKYTKWHPMGKTLMYDDDENTGAENPAVISVDNKQGMGDFWVLDFIKPRMGSTSSNQLSFRPESTLYWHER
ncbi:capsid protein [Lynx canadensis faeces associated genomovirus CL1 58]|nr:capsid protein [Lynx canadensis faeces associated genomovirus CL1 58]